VQYWRGYFRILYHNYSLTKGRDPFVCWGDRPTGWLHFTPWVQSAPFEIVEMDRIVSGKRGWVTRGLREYAWWGDRDKCQSPDSSAEF
jgi:hypothetical protein